MGRCYPDLLQHGVAALGLNTFHPSRGKTQLSIIEHWLVKLPLLSHDFGFNGLCAVGGLGPLGGVLGLRLHPQRGTIVPIFQLLLRRRFLLRIRMRILVEVGLTIIAE